MLLLGLGSLSVSSQIVALVFAAPSGSLLIFVRRFLDRLRLRSVVLRFFLHHLSQQSQVGTVIRADLHILIENLPANWAPNFRSERYGRLAEDHCYCKKRRKQT